MTSSPPSTIEEAIRHAGEGWLIDSFAPPENAISHIQQTLESVYEEARRRLGDNAPRISEAELMQEYHRNPLRVKGFFQALGGTRTPEMLLMVWRIIQGMGVQEIQLNYYRQQSFEVRVVLESPYGEQDAPYVSRKIQDFALFRHIGLLEIGGAPVFDGFYALRIRESS